MEHFILKRSSFLYHRYRVDSVTRQAQDRTGHNRCNGLSRMLACERTRMAELHLYGQISSHEPLSMKGRFNVIDESIATDHLPLSEMSGFDAVKELTPRKKGSFNVIDESIATDHLPLSEMSGFDAVKELTPRNLESYVQQSLSSNGSDSSELNCLQASIDHHGDVTGRQSDVQRSLSSNGSDSSELKCLQASIDHVPGKFCRWHVKARRRDGTTKRCPVELELYW
ncbi:hypothetical protein J6590_040568 [Homalodisca vitripennis]|nr:hypothetical protein J6590_040568 [Homalodisca vitripennis]